VLRDGVLASAAILVTGYLVGIVREPGVFASRAAERAHLAGRASFPHSFGAVWDGVVHANGEAVIVLGVLCLILTPVAGLVAGALAFARRGDWLFAAISATVLAVIMCSFVLGSLAT
jgi:uncharacterized membrane protein